MEMNGSGPRHGGGHAGGHWREAGGSEGSGHSAHLAEDAPPFAGKRRTKTRQIHQMLPSSIESGGLLTAVAQGRPARELGVGMGSFDPQGHYQPRQVVEKDLDEEALTKAMESSLLEVDDGDIVEGVVVRVDRDEVLVDIGYKSEGVVTERELSIRHNVHPSEVVSIGDRVEALVLQKEDKDGRLLLSKKRAEYEKAWVNIEKIKEANGVVRGQVIEVVKGGLIVDIGLRGFLPASLIELRRVRDLEPYLGKEIQAKIIELDRHRNNVVLSRRTFLEEAQREQREVFLENLKPGERRKGRISSVVPFGAFVDLGGMDGLIHVSELSWHHIDQPSDVVSIGDEVEVEVLEVDLAKERISLSLKNTQVDPWQQFAETHKVGELVYGRVTKLVPFGAFIQVGDDIEGLVHISEMAAYHVDSPEQVISVGEELWVKIIEFDLARRRISLSIKQAAEGGEVAEEYREAFGEHAYDEEGNYIGPEYDVASFEEPFAEEFPGSEAGLSSPAAESEDVVPEQEDAASEVQDSAVQSQDSTSEE